MISILARNQNWAKAAPWLGLITTVLLFTFFQPSQALFWALINIPLYLFHQTEEHYWPGGFKDYMNRVMYKLPPGEEKLTDEKVFWINILFVWVAFSIFGLLNIVSLGFGLLIIIFSMMNCASHIMDAIRRKCWNPGLVMASLQILISFYAAYFVTSHGLSHPVAWWIGTILFSILIHAVLFRFVMGVKAK
ncbi:HXXEE domain-containing protein [Paenibacillus pasadenensis]|uniref:HXXEE domain-containing protein n=1 Tax=Paenibacillus pasadenensis TaxID=217090 RepID=UPI002040A105|nr:HXXEE domain-containing protein [Paenibacillus pasadenensis]MCM3746096.1 HXXEE domain-containing protein [Paenibacillus pasadenensis]